MEDVLDTGVSSIASEFVCRICTELIPYRGAVTVSKCGHAFCGSCLEEWLAMSGRQGADGRCPTCSTTVRLNDEDDVCPIERSNPLAWRILGKLRVRCPLAKVERVRCAWVGDYSELHGHVTACAMHNQCERETVDEVTKKSRRSEKADPTSSSIAEALKEQGNARFNDKQYNQAIQLYSQAIAAEPREPKYLLNRAAAWMSMGAFDQGLKDCERALFLDVVHVKGIIRKGKCLCHTDSVAAARQHFIASTQLLQSRGIEPPAALSEESSRMETLHLALEECRAVLRSGRFAAAARHMEDICALFTRESTTTEVNMLRARVAVGVGRLDDAQRITRTALKEDRSNVEALSISAEAIYQGSEGHLALVHIKEALRLDPDNRHAIALFRHIKQIQSLVAAGKAAMESREFEVALVAFSEVLKGPEQRLKDGDEQVVDLTQSDREELSFEVHMRSALAVELFEARANCLLRLKRYEECLGDCGKALYLASCSTTAVILQAKALGALGRYEEAVKELRLLVEFDQHGKIRAQYERTVFEMRRARRPDYYEIVGASRVASAVEIKKAYKQKAFELHPDRCPPDQREAAEVRFKELQEALDILSDDMKRELYNEGYDKEAIEERVEAAKRAAHKSPHHHHHHHHHHT